MDANAIIALAALVVTIIVASASLYLGKQQLALMNTQAEAAKDQADAAKVQADGSVAQAAAATEALQQAARWRAEEERRGEPQFRVTAATIRSFKLRDGRMVPPGENLLASVHVLVENISSHAVPINHVGIENISSGDVHIYGSHAFGLKLPHRLAAGDQIEGSLPASAFFMLLGAFLDDRDDDLPEEGEFVVFVAKSPFTARTSAVIRWNSEPFTVRLPSPQWLHAVD